MSTLAACRADNFYRPPDYDPKNRQKEIEKKRKEGKLKVRKQGARKIRFEMPFHVRCTICQHMIAKGVRFNAVKKKAGRYLGTIIFQFVMPCPDCKGTIIIKTDPKNCEYLLVSGCVKYETDYDDSKQETYKIQTPEEGEALNRNAFLKLETQKIDIIKAEEKKSVLKDIIEEKKVMKNDFLLNQTMRRQLKIEKIQNNKIEEESKSKGLSIRLLPMSEEDKLNAQLARFKGIDRKFEIRDRIRFQPIFEKSMKPTKSEKIKDVTNILNKKHLLDRSLQISLEKNQINKREDTFVKSFKISTKIIMKKKI